MMHLHWLLQCATPQQRSSPIPRCSLPLPNCRNCSASTAASRVYREPLTTCTALCSSRGAAWCHAYSCCLPSPIVAVNIDRSSRELKQECCSAFVALAEAGLFEVDRLVASGLINTVTRLVSNASPSVRESAVVMLAHACGLS